MLSSELIAKIDATSPRASDVKYVFSTRSGPGPTQQPIEEALLDPATGLPVPPGPKHRRLQIQSYAA